MLSLSRFNLRKVNLRVVLRRCYGAETTGTGGGMSPPTMGHTITPQTQPFVNPITPTTTTRILPPAADLVPQRSNVASFDDIPGPISLTLLQKIWNILPVLGTEFTSRMVQYAFSAGKLFGSQLSWGSPWWQHLFGKFFRVYGPIIRLRGPFGGDVVLISRPEHVRVLFNNELKYPVRASLDSLEKYCLQNRKSKQAGLFLMNGVEWEKVRQTIEKPLSESGYEQMGQIDQICDEFVTRIMSIRNAQEEMPSNFRDEIFKWSLECLCCVLMSRRLGCLEPTGLSNSSDPARLINGLKGATDAVQKCEFGFHVWKFFETPSWRSLVKHCDSIDSVLSKYIQRAQETLKIKSEDKTRKLSLLESLLMKETMYPEDVMTLLLDMMIVGVNATAHTVSFLFYHLAKSPRCQLKLYDEICRQPDTITRQELLNMPYMQACIKEVLRLKPPIPFLTRVTNNDTIIHNYMVPKGTHVMIATRIASLRDEHFEDSHKFLPERWLNPDLGLVDKELKDFAFMPYGCGPRECMAKEVAEMQISLLMAKVLRKFRVEYYYADISSTQKLFAMPDKPLKFRFVERI